jgi:signal transduction histidine kinase
VPTIPGGDSTVTETSTLRRFFHDLATPLSGLSLHLERAHRLAQKGEDASEALEVARRELEKAFVLFEQGRAALLAGPGQETV